MKRILLAAIAGAIAMFVWTSVAHMVLPLGAQGIRELPNEATVLQPLQSAAGNTSGLYLYPGMGAGPNPSMAERRAAMPAYEQKLKTMPSGMLIYHPPGRPAMTSRQLGIEFANEFLEALFAVVLLSCAGLRSYTARVGFVTLVGVVASMPTNVSYWNWYGFPGSYTAAYMVIQIVGFLVVGLIAGALLQTGQVKATPAAA